MPELPEVETIRKGLQKTILKKKIVDLEIRLPKIVSVGPAVVSNIRTTSSRTARTFRGLMVGHKFTKINRRAKMLLLELSSGLSLPRRGEGGRPPAGEAGRPGEVEPRQSLPLSNSPLARREGKMVLLIHLKMTGQLIYAKKGEKKVVKIFNSAKSPTAELPHKYTHAIFTFADGSKLFFNDLRQFGYLRLVRDENISEVRELKEYGPEPFGRQFTLDYLSQKAKSRQKLSVKQFLMEPKVVSGIGNIYSDEILFCAKVRPARRVRSLQKADFKLIYKCVPQVLKKALKAQGSSVGDFFKVDGSEGRFHEQHMVYQRYGEPCKVCGETIEKLNLGGRTSSYCPACQR